MRTITAFFVLSTGILWADQVTLSNGDRLTGTIVRSDTENLVMDTELAGTVTIPWSAVTDISAEGPLFVGLSDGQTVAGSVESTGGEVRVQTEAAGVVTAAQSAVQTLRNQAEQTAFETEIERFRNPRLVDLWTGFLDLGYAATRGNADTQTFTVSTRAERSTTRDKISAYYTSIFSSSDVSGTSQATANSKRGGLTYDVNLDEKYFAWGAFDLESDQFQNLDLRFVPAGGLGYHAINNEATKLDVRLGAAGNREFFSTGLNRNSAEILVGEDLIHTFSATTSLQQKLRFFPNLTNGGAYRINFDTTLATAFAEWFSLQFTVSDRYLSNPVPGRQSNDVLFSTGVRLSFAQ